MRIIHTNKLEIDHITQEGDMPEDILFSFLVFFKGEECATGFAAPIILSKVMEFIAEQDYFDDYDEWDTDSQIEYIDYRSDTEEVKYQVKIKISCIR